MLTILDPNSLLGQELVEAVVHGLPEVRRRFFHTRGTEEHLIAEVAGEPVLVPPLNNLDELEGCSVVALTASLPAALAGPLLEWLRRHPAVHLLDGTQPGVAGSEAACVALSVPPSHGRLRWFHLADPALAGPVRLLAALAPLGPMELHATLILPVSGLGADAVEELAAQGASRLSGHSPRAARYLPSVLAFDLMPAATEGAAALEAQLAELAPTMAATVHLAHAGVFHGHIASVGVRCAQATTAEEARALVRAHPSLRLARRTERLHVSATSGADQVTVGQLRVCGDWVWAWVAADGLRLSGADTALSLLAAVLAS
jgi:hypothetical protein